MADVEVVEDPCAAESGDAKMALRIGGIFIILVTSACGVLFPIVGKRYARMPKHVFDFAKFVPCYVAELGPYFGSGVLIATAFIHLLTPAAEQLGSECLSGAWGDYPWANAIAMMSLLAVFLVELFAFRIGTAKLKAAGFGAYDAHGHDGPSHASHGPEMGGPPTPPAVDDIEAASVSGDVSAGSSDEKHGHGHGHDAAHSHAVAQADHQGDLLAQILGVAILEFGVVFHSIFIGLTLATDPDFTVLFIVIIFHQTFEGLGLGARLAFLPLPHKYNWVPAVAGVSYACVTPIGMAIGLGVRASYNGNATKTLVASGVLDAISAGIVLYTAAVELLAHEFIFNKEMIHAPIGKVLYAVGSLLTGAGVMALLGYWA